MTGRGPKSPLVFKSQLPATAHSSGGSATKECTSKSKAQPTPQQLAMYAERIVARAFLDSHIADNTFEYPKFAWNELSLGKVLGKGGFGTVSEVRAFEASTSSKPTSFRSQQRSARSLLHNKDNDKSDSEADPGEAESRHFISDHCLRNGGDARYAVKRLSPETLRDPSLLLQGTVDLAIEARILSAISHPNIIKMRAMADTPPCQEGYFLVLDRLYDTLEKRLPLWAARHARCSGLSGKLWDRSGDKASALREERLVAAYDLAAALAYLHNLRIVYRDLKPENIGFDIRGDIKIFDFGLAKELREKLRNSDGSYRLTEMTGSPRYMAPEVANALPYTEACDVYSFAILLWEMMALKRPFELYTPKGMRDQVYNAPHKRPAVDASWPNSLKICLKRSWDPDWRQRNTMEQVESILRKECVAARSGDDSGLEHNRRRSTFVYRPPKPSKSTAGGAGAGPAAGGAPPHQRSRAAVRAPTPPEKPVAPAMERQDTERDMTEIEC